MEKSGILAHSLFHRSLIGGFGNSKEKGGLSRPSY
jgi:hypothetical protein